MSNSTKGAIQFEVTADNDEFVRFLEETCRNIINSGEIAADAVAKINAAVGLIPTSPVSDSDASKLKDVKAKWEGWTDEYQQIEDKITAIKKKANEDRARIAAAQEQNPEYKAEGDAATLVVNRGEATQIHDLEIEKSKLVESWGKLFPDLEGMSRIGVKRLIDVLREQIGDEELPPFQTEALEKQLEKAEKYATKFKPFGELGLTQRGVKKAKDDLETAKKVEIDAPIGVEKDAATAKRKEAEATVADKKKERADAVSANMKNISGVANETSNLLKNFGVESPAVDGVVSSLSALGEINFSNPMSIITGGLKAVSALIGGIFGQMDAAKEKEIANLQEDIDELQETYDKLGAAIDASYSSAKSNTLEESNEKLLEQNNLIAQQRELEESKKKTDDSKIAGYNKAIEENNKKIEENKVAARDAIFGADLKAAIDDFANAYVNAWAAGEDRSKAQKDVVKNMIKGIIQEMIKSDIAAHVEKMRKTIEDMMSDDLLDEDELMAIDGLGADIGDIMEARGKLYEKILSGDQDERQEASARGVASMSQETASELNGQFAAMQGMLFDVRDNQLQVLQLHQLHLPNLQYLSQLSHLSTISENTAYCRRLEGIEIDMSAVKSELQTMNQKGIIIRK